MKTANPYNEKPTEKEMADPNARVERNDLGGGRSEYK